MNALITGGSSGMGLEYARQLAVKGCRLLIVSNREDELQQARGMLISTYGADVIAHCADLAAPDAADALHRWCAGIGFIPDILINNAGMFFWKELEPADLPRAEAIMHLHMHTPTRLCILFGDDMKKRGSGYILNMASMAAELPVPGITLYSATKAYLKSFGKSLHFEMRPYGIGVTTVCPAAIATPLYKLKPSLMDFGVKIGVIKTPRWLVKKALKGMFKRRRCVAPGFMNIYLPPLIAILPHRAVDRLWKRFR